MEATPGAQPEILRIRDDILMRDLPATPSPKQAAPPRPAQTALKKRKAKSTTWTETTQEKEAVQPAKSAAAVAARAEAAAELAIDNIPGRFWKRHAEFRLYPDHGALQLLPELAATHGKWKKMLGKMKAAVKENSRLRRLRTVVRKCKEKGYIAISIVEACAEAGMDLADASSIAAASMQVGTRTIRRWRALYKQNGGE